MTRYPGLPDKEQTKVFIGNPGGHNLFCWNCKTFRIHKASMINGGGRMEIACLTCNKDPDVFVLVADRWIPEPIVESLDKWAKLGSAAGTLAYAYPEPEPIPEKPKKAKKVKRVKSETETTPKIAMPTPAPAPAPVDPFAGIDLSTIRTYADALAATGGVMEKANDLHLRATADKKAKREAKQ